MIKSFFVGIGLMIMSSLLGSCQNDQTKLVKVTHSKTLKSQDFVGKESCKECHQKEFKEWQGSDHDLAMQVANEKTVLGDFNNITYKSKGISYKFFKKGKDFYVNTEGENGEYKDFKIANTFGVRPLQQYLIDFSRGRKQCLTVAWDTEKKRWFDVQPEESVHPKEWMHWTGGSMTWNNMCADCHSTNLHKNYDLETDTYHTTYSEINVACEACHGPASVHVDFYKNPKKHQGQKAPELFMGTTTKGTELVDKCARCHARRSQLTPFYDYKGHFLDHYKPNLTGPPEYFMDGQILDEDYVYGSFVQSKMYHYGVSCRDCHNMHTLKLKKQGNNLCLQCHEKTYDSPKHHFHKSGTKESLCINCHMTGRYYMGVDFRRDHSFRIPRPDQSAKYGTPNACTGCHKNKSNEWAAKAIEKHFGHKPVHHYSDDLLEGYQVDRHGFEKTFSQKKYPKIIRATALYQFANSDLSPEAIQKIMLYINDSTGLVRNESVLGLDRVNAPAIAQAIKPRLSDSIRLVRIASARYFTLHRLPIDTTSQAYKEYITQLMTNADFASGQHQLALFYQAKGQIDKAIKAYEKALQIDNYFNMARMNLALLYYQQGQIKKAEQLYKKVIEQEPEYSYPYYMLGLLYNETGQKDKALNYLELATYKKPPIARAFYNYALMLQMKGDYKKSLKVIQKGLEKFPNDENLLYLKFLAEQKLNNTSAALSTLKLLLQLNPDNPTYKNILDSFEK